MPSPEYVAAARPLPTVGRIVHYKLSEHDVRLIDERYPMYDADGNRAARNPVSPGDVFPAIVVRVFVGASCVNLQVLLDGVGSHWATSVSEGDGPCQWSWPPRV